MLFQRIFSEVRGFPGPVFAKLCHMIENGAHFENLVSKCVGLLRNI